MGSVSESEEIAILSMAAQERTYKKSDIRGGRGGWGWMFKAIERLIGMVEG